ncbi:MAG TPA: DUF222 domain-containing protein, partial [Microbacterium sp.]|uniref:HNH endonuclease signature motif containing protein n=1 Tax=Microbacterium sp. TaxID=51671 RepID=UPI002CA10E30
TGAMGVDAAAAVADALGPLSERCAPHDLAAAETALVTAATGDADSPPCTPDEVRVMAQTWALVLDPDGTLPDEAKGLRRRGITIGREREGTVPLRGELLPAVAAQFQRLVDAFLNPRVDAPAGPSFTLSDGAIDRDDEEYEAAVLAELRDPRSHTQKRHDALAGILSVAARAEGTPSIGGAAPVLVVTMTAADVESDDGVGFIEGTDTVVTSAFARTIACTGAVQRLVTDSAGRIIELGSPLRTFTVHQRRAIAQRDGGCVIPGCHVGATWCEVHHVRESSRGGPTHTDNGVLLCWHHHRTIDSGGWQIAMIDGMPHIKAPHYLDPYGRWRPASGSLHRRRDRLLAERAGPRAAEG